MLITSRFKKKVPPIFLQHEVLKSHFPSRILMIKHLKEPWITYIELLSKIWKKKTNPRCIYSIGYHEPPDVYSIFRTESEAAGSKASLGGLFYAHIFNICEGYPPLYSSAAES